MMLRYQVLLIIAAVFAANIMPETLLPNAVVVVACLVLAWLCYVHDAGGGSESS